MLLKNMIVIVKNSQKYLNMLQKMIKILKNTFNIM